MTIRLTNYQYYDHFHEAEEEWQSGALDKLDVTCKFDARFGRGWERKIVLREGIDLKIEKGQYNVRLLTKYPEFESSIVRCCFTLSAPRWAQGFSGRVMKRSIAP